MCRFQLSLLNSTLPHRVSGSSDSRATIAPTTVGMPGAVVSRIPLYEAAAPNTPGRRAANASAPYPPVDTPATARRSLARKFCRSSSMTSSTWNFS